jgi:hypothetical protein
VHAEHQGSVTWSVDRALLHSRYTHQGPASSHTNVECTGMKVWHFLCGGPVLRNFKTMHLYFTQNSKARYWHCHSTGIVGDKLWPVVINSPSAFWQWLESNTERVASLWAAVSQALGSNIEDVLSRHSDVLPVTVVNKQSSYRRYSVKLVVRYAE